MDRGFFLTLQAMRRQLAAMPCEYYQIRLIHGISRKPFPGDRIWSSVQLTTTATVAFLRLRNREGYDIFFHPFAGDRNAGYILIDLDDAPDQIIDTMRANGHEPCVVLRTSPAHLQAWIRVSLTPLPPLVATSVAAQLAALYGADPASADWRHCGRLAGFTNRKPARRQPDGYAPWTLLLHAQPRLATRVAPLFETAPTPQLLPPAGSAPPCAPIPCSLTSIGASRVYWRWFHRLQIPDRFSATDWSIADLWIAQHLLRCRIPIPQIQAVLRLASPGFPRGHADPEDYLRRTLARAAQPSSPFPARPARTV